MSATPMTQEATALQNRLTRHMHITGVARSILLIVLLVILGLFILGPLVTLFLWAFADRWFYPALLPQSWTFSWWREILLNGDIGNSIILSFIFAPLVTLLSAV